MPRLYDWLNDPQRNEKIFNSRLNDEFDNAYAVAGAVFDTVALAEAATIDGSFNAIQVAGYYAAGDGGAALYKRVVAEPAHDGKLQSADGSWWEIAETFINPMMLGAKFDDSTDDGAAINSAIGIGRPIRLPAGIARSGDDITIDAAIKFVGSGWNATEIKFTDAAKGIIVTSTYAMLSDFRVTSTVAAASRTVAGIKITAAASPYVLVERVHSAGHLYGIWNQGAGNEFRNCHTYFNDSHGIYLDGSVTTMNETSCNDCQSNANVGNGFHVVGGNGGGGATPTAGVYFYRPTAAANDGHGMVFVDGVNDVYITAPELSTNAGVNLDTSSNGPAVSFSVTGGLIEASALQGIWIGADVAGFTITGVTITCAAQAIIVVVGTDVTITGNVFAGAATAGGAIELGSGSANVVIVGNRMSDLLGATPILRGILIDAGAAKFTAIGNDLTGCTTPIVGSYPSGSLITNNMGDSTHTVGAWTTNADVAVNGYCTVIDSSGNIRKLATIA